MPPDDANGGHVVASAGVDLMRAGLKCTGGQKSYCAGRAFVTSSLLAMYRLRTAARQVCRVLVRLPSGIVGLFDRRINLIPFWQRT